MDSNIFSTLKLSGKLKSYVDDTRGGTVTAAFGLPFSARSYALSRVGGFPVYVLSDHIAADRAAEALALFTGGDCPVLPAKEEVLLYKKAVSHDSVFGICSVLYALVRGKASALTLTAEALTRPLPSRARFEAAIITLRQNEDYDTYGIVSGLVRAGYRREEQVSGRGQFALRGGILDVFPVQETSPFRLEFFGDTLDEIRVFDPDTQISSSRIEAVEIAPATDVLIEDSEIAAIEREMLAEFRARNTSPAALARLKGIIDDVMTSLEAGSRDTALSYCLPYSKAYGSLAEYLPKDAVIALDEPKLLSDRITLIYGEHDSRFTGLLESGELMPAHFGQLRDRQNLVREFAGFRRTVFSGITQVTAFFQPEVIYNIGSTKTPRYNGNYRELAADIRNWTFGGYAVMLLSRDSETCANVGSELADLGLGGAVLRGMNERAVHSECALLPEKLHEGAVLHDIKLVLVGTSDFLRAKKSAALPRGGLKTLAAPEVGDYVVHETHGIGVCRGIKRLSLPAEKEYLAVEFRDGDMLYVPCERIDILAKHSGSEASPKLSKMGGKEFAALKERVKKSVREMAIDLRNLYLAREREIGHAFSPDTELQREFESAFEHDETADQLRSTDEIKADMESGRVMDRLLCGDVGYGKTEVALRAVFKAVCDGKQAAILAPTTVLCQQHYNLCLKRFSGFGLRIGALNRFYSQREQTATVKALSEGRLDIVCATHRLLSKDVSFFDLGLLIVDEEQRFGVEDKEKLKVLKENVDVLTLSATPIPRTLHLSMTGIRDISVLETPPRERLPVQTYVVEYSETLLRDALLRELSRGGQAFVLYNRVESIDSFAHRVSRIVPEASVIAAHGQMKETALEDAVMKFYSGERNVLVCTTIIENGIDIPAANTLVVVDADRLGLAQLYQLRGRVGRSNRLAHVYFTYAEDKVLTESAYKRLLSILEFTEFGSGFKIAMRDLEIRGAGSVLGREQHGHMERVGYDMYVRLLRQSVDELEGKRAESPRVETDIDVDAFIPDAYISDSSARIRVYQSIANLESETAASSLLGELRDIYGAVPPGVGNLVRIALMRRAARALSAAEVVIKKTGCAIVFRSIEAALENQALAEAVSERRDTCIMSFAERPMLIFKSKGLPLQKVFDNMYSFVIKFLGE